MGVFGDAESIAQYPDQVDAMVAAGLDEIGLGARLAELRAVISPTGWQPALALDVEKLRTLTVPTLLSWGEYDPLGGTEVAHAAAAAIPMLSWSCCRRDVGRGSGTRNAWPELSVTSSGDRLRHWRVRQPPVSSILPAAHRSLLAQVRATPDHQPINERITMVGEPSGWRRHVAATPICANLKVRRTKG